MTSATLFREGLDLDELLAELDAEHAGRVRVVDVEYGRDGGVMGFFARRTVGVHYVLTAGDEPMTDTFEGPLEAMLRAAEAEEIASSVVDSGQAPDTSVGDNVEFARMLLDIAAQKAAERQAVTPAPAALPLTPLAPLVPRVVDSAPSGPEFADHSRGIRPLDEDVAATAPEPDWQATRAELLARARTRPVGAHRVAEPEPVPAPLPVAPPAPTPVVPAPEPVIEAVVEAAAEAAVEAHAPAPVRTPLTLRRQLSEIGVPLTWIGNESGSAYEVIEQLVRRVPTADRLDLGPGQLLVVAGPAARAQAEAARLCAQLRLDPAAIRTAGCGPDPIRHRRQAAALELDVRGQRGEPCIVVVATDSSGDTGGVADLEWAADIVAALAPDQLYLVVDATCRVADVRRTVAALGQVTALAVVAAARAASPASLWELGLAVASLDGTAATRGRWAALLIDRLTDLDGH